MATFGFNINVKKVRSKYAKTFSFKTRNGWQQVRPIPNCIKFYSPKQNQWAFDELKRVHSEPHILSFKYVEEESYILPSVYKNVDLEYPVWDNYKYCIYEEEYDLLYPPFEMDESPIQVPDFVPECKNFCIGYIRGQPVYGPLTFAASKSRNLIVNKIVRFTPGGIRTRHLGYLNGKVLFGPLTKREHYFRLDKSRRQYASYCINSLLFGRLTKYKVEQYGAYLASNRQTKSLPNVNVRATSSPRPKKNVNILDLEDQDWSVVDNFDWGEQDFNSAPQPQRSIMLLHKLRAVIRNMRVPNMSVSELYFLKATGKYVQRIYKRFAQSLLAEDLSRCESQILLDSKWRTPYDPCEECFESIELQPQMDKDSEGQGETIKLDDQKDDTTLIDQTLPNKDEAVFTARSWRNMVTADKIKDCNDLADRDLPIKNFEWSTSQNKGQEIFRMTLPYDALKTCFDQPIALNFKQHTYWSGDMRLIFQLNSNKAMVGQLIAYWYYAANTEPTFPYRDNIYSAVQMPHVLIDAGSSNPAVLQIDYGHIFPFMCTTKRQTEARCLDMGVLVVRVLSPLQASYSSARTATGVLYLRLFNNAFTGTVHSTLGFQKPQMMSAVAGLAVDAAELYLRNRFGLNNEDKPPVAINPTPVQICNSGNMAAGTSMVDFSQNMRLDPKGTTPYIGVDRREMTFAEIAKIPGILGTFEVSTGDKTGKLLYQCRYTPLDSPLVYPKVAVGEDSYCIIPPVGYVAADFKMVNIQLTYTFRFICNELYSLSVLIAFIPRVEGVVTFDQAKAGNYTVFNLQDSKTFDFTATIAKDRIAWPRQVAGGREKFDFPALGTIVVFVQNPLCINAIIPNKIECLVYVKAGPVCEFMVPVQSCISTVQYQYFKFTGQPGQAEPGYYPYYVGTSRYFRSNNKALLRFGAYLDHITFFRNLRTDGYYKYSGDDAPTFREKEGSNWIENKKKFKVSYGVAIKDPGNAFYWMAIVDTEADAQAFAKFKSDIYLMSYPNDDLDVDKMFGHANAAWNFTVWPEPIPTTTITSTVSTITSTIAQGRFDKHGTTSDFVPLRKTGHGLMLVGESFKSLTDLLRRPQYIARYDIDGDLLLKNYSSNISPSGIIDIGEKSTINVYIREGHISKYAQCHTWFKGGLVIKLVFKCDSLILNNTVMVQHRPDIDTLTADEDDILVHRVNHTYATCIQNVIVNPVMTLCIPNYQEALYGMLGFPTGEPKHDLVRMANLGKLYISSQQNCKVAVYQACGDDFKMFFFKGTPPVKFLDTFNSDAPPDKNLVDSASLASSFEHLEPQMAEDEVIPQGGAFSSVDETAQKINLAADKANDTIGKLDSMIDGAKDLWSNWFGKDSTLQKFFSLDKFLNVLSQFGHMLLSPTMPTILLGISTILISVLGIGFDWIQKLYTALCECFSTIWDGEQTSPVVAPQMECDFSDSLIGVLGSIATAAVGYKVSYSGSFMSTIRKMFVDINIFSRGLDGIIKLISHLFNVLGRFIKYIVLYAKGRPDINVLLKDQGDEMLKWAMHVEELLDPLKENENMMDDTFVDMINDFYFTGTVFQVQLANCARGSAASNYVKGTVERLREIRDKLCHMGKHPYTRLTPWSLWLTGAPGIGKSTIVTYITSACLKAIKYDKRIPHIYKYEPLAKNWDTFANNPFILVDDAFCVDSPTAIESLLTAYFCIVTNAPFTPPMAHLYNKYIRVQNLGMITCSNLDFPDGRGAIADKEAFYRRRHCMISVELKPEYDKEEYKVRGNLNLDKFTDEEKKKFVWLQFREYHDPRNSNVAEQVLTPPMEYDEFIGLCVSRFVKHYETEVKSMKLRVEEMTQVLCEATKPESSPIEVKTTLRDYWKKKICGVKQSIMDTLKMGDVAHKSNSGRKLSEKCEPVINIPDTLAPQMSDKYEIDAQEILATLKDLLNHDIIDERLTPTRDDPVDKFKDFFSKHYNKDVEVHISSRNPENWYHDIIKVFLKITKEQQLSDEEYNKFKVFVENYQSARSKDINCVHNDICTCHLYLHVEGDDWLVPTCVACDEANVMPTKLSTCIKYCLLKYPEKYTAEMRKSKIYQRMCRFVKLLRLTSVNFFKIIIENSKALVKSTAYGIYWILCKTISFMNYTFVPFVGLFILGRYLYKTPREQVANSIGTVGGYVTGQLLNGVDKLYKASDLTKDLITIGKERYMRVFSRNGEARLIPQSVYEGAAKVAGTKTPIKSLVVKHLEGQIDLDTAVAPAVNSYIDTVMDIVSRNTYGVSVEYMVDGGSRICRSRGTFIRNRQFLMVRHCWDELKDRVDRYNGIFYLAQAPNFIKAFDISKFKIDRYDKSNFVIVTFPALIPEHKNIVKHIPTMAQHQKMTQNGVVLTVDKNRSARFVHMTFVNDPRIVKSTPNSDDITMVGSYSYDFGGDGVCGSWLLCSDTNPCLIGMHVAGLGDRVGYSEPLIREMFEDVPSYDDVNDIVLPELLPLHVSEHELDGVHLQLGVVEPQFAHHESGKTKIVPSLCHGIFPVTTAPNPLSVNDPRLPPGTSPMIEGVAKMGQPIKGFPTELLTFARDCLTSELRTCVQPIIGVKPVSLQEAICGRAGIAGFSPLNFNTSEGYPFTAFRPPGATNKKYLFSLELDQDGYKCKGINQRLLNVMRYKQGLRENKIVPFTIFTDCLKDKRLPHEKNKIPGKTRVFSISPVDYSIQFRQYFLPYTVAHQNSRRTFSTAVGINVLGKEWTAMVMEMNDFGRYQCDGDYSNFGSGFDMEVFSIVIDCLKDWFIFHGDDDQKNSDVRTILLRELLSAKHLCYDIIYQVVSGMPSGSPITVELNDLINYCYVCMAWHEIMSPFGYGSLYYFNKFVKKRTYGDDLWLAIRELVIDYFNNVTLSEYFAKYGVKYTSASKGDDMIPYTDILNVSFLKRTPVPHPTRPNMFLAKLDLQSALDIANWCWQSRDPVSSTLVNIEACNDALYGFGPETHEYYRKILLKQAHRLGKQGNLRSWAELDHLYLGEYQDIYEIRSRNAAA